jgi:hypothetical protein
VPQADAFQIVRDREGSPDDLREMGLRNLVQVNEEPKVFHTVYLAQPSACAGRAMSHYGGRKSVLFFGREHAVVAPFRWGVKTGM